MTSKNDLHKLIINNLAIIETARSVLPEVQETVFSVINAKIKEWVKDQKTGENKSETWDGEFDYAVGDEDTVFYPEKWINENGHAAFSLGHAGDENFDPHAVSLICNQITPISDNYMYIAFAYPYSNLSTVGARKKNAWKTFIRNKYELNKEEFSQNSIELDALEGYLFIRLAIDPQLLAESYPDNIEDALMPIDIALEKIKNVYPIIDAIHEEALKL